MVYDKSMYETDYNLKSLIRGEWHFHPLTVMYRRDALDTSYYNKYPFSMDVVLFFELLKGGGKGHCFPEAMAVYRHHVNGVWSEVALGRKREMEFKARIGIYEVEHTDDAALFLLYQFAKPISRKWMLYQCRLMIKILVILYRHFGFVNVCRILYRKLIMNKLMPASVAFELSKMS